MFREGPVQIHTGQTDTFRSKIRTNGKLLIWNIQQGGGPRRQRIADSIIENAPDIVALIEFVPSTSLPLLHLLRDAGFEHQICTN